jgi:hypothetical protein
MESIGKNGNNEWLNKSKNMVRIFLDGEYHEIHNKQVHVWNS